MNTIESQHVKDYFDYHPSKVVLTIPSTGQSCNGLLDHSFNGGDRDKAGVKNPVLMAHFSCHIDYASYFIDKRNTTVSIESINYKIVNAELLNSQGVVSVWLV